MIDIETNHWSPPKKVIAIVPAKGKSTRVENKNTRYLGSDPLFVITLKKLLSIKEINEVYIDSEDDYILNVGQYVGAKPFKRDPSLATNDTRGHALFANAVQHLPEADVYVTVMCTSPFLRKEKIAEAIHILRDKPEYDSVVMVKKEKLYEWERDRMREYMNSFEISATTSEGMNLYVIRGDTAKELGRRIGLKPYALVGSPLDTLDIDYEEDWQLAELVMKGMQHGNKDSK